MTARDTHSTIPRALVLLAARNGATNIERQIASVLAQRGVDVQLRVRDDGSTDGTRDVVAALALVDPRVHLVADHVSSGSAAGNFFRLIRDADVSGFDVVAFCDQDDQWFPGKLETAVRALAGAGADGYSAAVQALWADGRRKRLRQNPVPRRADYLFEGAGQGCTFVMTLRLFSAVREALEVARDQLPAIRYHDWTVYAIARSGGMRWHFDPDPVMTYHQHAANDTGARSSLAGIARRVAQIRDGSYRAQVNAIAAFVTRVQPQDVNAARWRSLEFRRSVPGTIARVRFVLANGRRRFIDRIIQVVAVVTGHL